MKKKTNTALLLIVVIGIAILIGSLAIMLPDVEDGPEDTDRTPTVTTDTAASGDPEDPSEPEDTVKNGYTISVQNTNSSWVYADGIETDEAYLYGKRVIEFVQDVGYRHPDKVLVIGALSTWYKGSGYLEIYNATSDVTVIYEPVQTFKVMLNATNCNIASDVKIVDYSGTASFTVKPNAGYKLDHIENMSWTGSCTKFAYDNDSGVLTVGGIVSDLTITVTPVVQTYSVTFIGEEYFTVYQYQATGTDEGNYTFADGEYHAWILAPISGYKISNVEFQGIRPDICMLETNIDGANVGAAFQIGGYKPTSYDIKIIVSVEKLPETTSDTYTLKLNDTEYGTGTFDVDSLTFSPGETIEFIAYFNSDHGLDTLQLYADDNWITTGFEYSCIGNNGFSVITMTFADDDNFVSEFGSEPKEFELCLSTCPIYDADFGISVDTGGEGLGGPIPNSTNPGGAIIVDVIYHDGYTFIDGWSYTGPDGTSSPDWVEVDLRTINGRDYIIFKFADDAPEGILMFGCWFA